MKKLTKSNLTWRQMIERILERWPNVNDQEIPENPQRYFGIHIDGDDSPDCPCFHSGDTLEDLSADLNACETTYFYATKAWDLNTGERLNPITAVVRYDRDTVVDEIFQ